MKITAGEARSNIELESVMKRVYSQIEERSKDSNQAYVWYVPSVIIEKVFKRLRQDGFKVKRKWFSISDEFYIHW